jgi:hypothetical protein
MATNENGDTPGMRIDDPEELSQSKRVRELLNRRSGVIDARTKAKDAWVSGELDQIQALRVYQNGIEGLILDLWTKFLNEENGEHLLKEEKIDEIIVYPPEKLRPSDKSDFAAGEDAPEPEKVPVEGLVWYVNNGPVIQREFTAYMWNPPGQQTEMGSGLVGFENLDRALQECVEFIDKTGIDADMEEETQQSEIDRELLEEVDEWRQNNT